MDIRKGICLAILALLLLCSLANFYRNRDPYRAFFFVQDDRYLTTHLLKSDLDRSCLELETRLSGKVSPHFYRAIQHYYGGKKIVVEDDRYFDIQQMAETTGVEFNLQGERFKVMAKDVPLLLREGVASFYYGPHVFSPQRDLAFVTLATADTTKNRPCWGYNPVWEGAPYPLLMVLLPVSVQQPVDVRVLRYGNYIFFLPSNHPALHRFSS